MDNVDGLGETLFFLAASSSVLIFSFLFSLGLLPLTHPNAYAQL